MSSETSHRPTDMEWTRHKTLELIECYRSHTLLWQPSHILYKNRTKRSDAWLDIANILHVEQKEAEKKMKNLIAQFRRELKKKLKRKKSGSSGGDIYHSKWFGFESMLFLLENSYGLVHALRFLLLRWTHKTTNDAAASNASSHDDMSATSGDMVWTVSPSRLLLPTCLSTL